MELRPALQERLPQPSFSREPQGRRSRHSALRLLPAKTRGADKERPRPCYRDGRLYSRHDRPICPGYLQAYLFAPERQHLRVGAREKSRSFSSQAGGRGYPVFRSPEEMPAMVRSRGWAIASRSGESSGRSRKRLRRLTCMSESGPRRGSGGNGSLQNRALSRRSSVR